MRSATARSDLAFATLLCALLALGACAADETGLAIVELRGPSEQARLIAPATAHPGVSFTVSVVTWVPDCYAFRSDSTDVVTEGDDLVLLPYVSYSLPDEDTTCLRIDMTLSSVVSLEFATTGNKTIRVRGLRLTDSTRPRNGERIDGEVIDIPFALVVE